MWIPGISRRQTWLLWGLLLYVPPFSTYNIRYVFNIQHSISGTYPIFNIQYQVLEVFGPPCPNFQFDFWIVKKCHLVSFLQKSWDFLDRQFLRLFVEMCEVIWEMGAQANGAERREEGSGKINWSSLFVALRHWPLTTVTDNDRQWPQNGELGKGVWRDQLILIICCSQTLTTDSEGQPQITTDSDRQWPQHGGSRRGFLRDKLIPIFCRCQTKWCQNFRKGQYWENLA